MVRGSEGRALEEYGRHQGHYASASVVTSDRVVFNIKGNDYRLVAVVNFKRSIVFIKWIGAHAAYDKIDVAKVRYGD